MSKTELSNREREVLKLLLQGYLSKEIAGMLGIAYRTVGVHRENIARKLEVDTKNSAALMRYAVRTNLIVW